MANVGGKEYKTLYYSDSESGRATMRTEVDRLSAKGWHINPLQATGAGDELDNALMVKEAVSQTPKLMLIMEREKQ